MTGHELIAALQNHDLDLPVYFRARNGNLVSLDEVYTDKDTFETRIEIA